MPAGLKSLFAIWLGGNTGAPAATGPAPQAGYRGLLAFWAGGAAGSPPQASYRGLLAFWAGGAASAVTPRPSGGGDVDWPVLGTWYLKTGAKQPDKPKQPEPKVVIPGTGRAVSWHGETDGSGALFLYAAGAVLSGVGVARSRAHSSIRGFGSARARTAQLAGNADLSVFGRGAATDAQSTLAGFAELDETLLEDEEFLLFLSL